MSGKPIPISTANEMTRLFVEYVQNLEVETKKKTQYVSFTLPEIMKWLQDITPYTDELRVYLGIDTDASPQAGRLTAIIWPYRKDRPATRPFADGKDGGGDEEGVDPYNDGSTGP